MNPKTSPMTPMLSRRAALGAVLAAGATSRRLHAQQSEIVVGATDPSTTKA